MKKIKLLTGLTSLASLTAITIPLTGCSCTNPTDPTVHTVESVEVASNPTTTTFKIGETFNAKGLVLKYKEDDGSRWLTDRDFTTDYDDYTFTSADVGEQTVTVTYKNKTCTYKINIEESGIELIFKPYVEGAYAMLDDQGDPKAVDIKKDQMYIAKIVYDPTAALLPQTEIVLGTETYDYPIYSEEVGEYSCKTSIGSSLTITPLGQQGEEYKNCGYLVDGFEYNTAQTVTITFKAVKDYPNVTMFVFTGL